MTWLSQNWTWLVLLLGSHLILLGAFKHARSVAKAAQGPKRSMNR